MTNDHKGPPQDVQDIAIIGISLRFPGARDPEEFWQNLRSGVESRVQFTDAELRAAGIEPAVFAQPGYVRTGFVVPQIDLFDADFFGYSRRQAELTDPQQRLFLECVWEALERAGIDPARAPGPVGLYAGACLSSYLLRYYGAMQRLDGSANKLQTLLGNDKDYLASQAAYHLGLTGPCVTVQTACSTGLVATHLACQSLLSRECDIALAGAATLRVPQEAGYQYEEGALFSPDGHCRAFDAQARGTVAGNGVAVIVLKRLVDAIAQRDNILAVIKGSAINNDGSMKIGYTAPSEEGQANVISEALGVADIDPVSITYIEAHGTGTPLGDPIEIAALKRAFAAVAGRRNHCAIGSVKTNIGHLENAAGLAGLIKTVLSLLHRELPPSLHFSSPNPQLGLKESPFYINHQLSPWLQPSGAAQTPRRAGVSSFGIGGTNAHVIVEEAPVLPTQRNRAARPLHLLPISAKSREALAALLARHADFLPTTSADWADICFTAAAGRAHFSHRAAVVAATKEQAEVELRLRLNQLPKELDALVPATAKRRPRIAFLFTGQGSQYVGMGRELYEAQPQFRKTIDACDLLMKQHMGRSLTSLLYPAAAGTGQALLDSHTCGLVANFALECALFDLWCLWGVQPDVVLGHSLGDFAAAYAAGVMSLEDGLKLVVERGRLMELAHGAMVSAIASVAEVTPLLGNYPDVALAVVNAPRSVVLSGGTDSITRLTQELTQAGFKNQLLTIPVAAHSSLLDPVLQRFEAAVGRVTLRPPTRAVVSSMTGGLVANELTQASYWRQHLRNPVRFADGVVTLCKQGIDLCIEIGPKPTLLGIVGQCLEGSSEPPPVLLPSLRDKRGDWQQILESAAELYVRGVDLNWDAIYGTAQRKVIVPTYPFQRARYWISAERTEDLATRTDWPQRDVGSASPVPAVPSSLADCLYELAWRPSATGSTAPESIVSTLRAGLQHTAAGLDSKLKQYQSEMAALDAQSVLCIKRTLAGLGFCPQSDPPTDVSALAAHLGVVPAYHRWLAHALATVCAWPETTDPSAVDSPSAGALVQTEAQLLLRCGARLGDVLQGRCDPLTLLFPDGDLSASAPLYSASPDSQLVNSLAQQAVLQVLAAQPSGTPLRVLELGAGTGGTTAQILPSLPSGAVQYLFTDVSPFFLKKAQTRFKEYPFLSYEVLDIEKPVPTERKGTFDLVLAANVLHATRDLSRTLAHVKELLSPGGVLLLLEGCAARPWLDVTYGLTAGWWHGTDREVRPDYPLLHPDAWLSLLERSGFQQSAALVPTGVTQAVILAKKPESLPGKVEDSLGSWLILADRSGVGERLAQALRARGGDCTLLFAGDKIEPVVAQAAATPFCKVVSLWSLDSPVPAESSSEANGAAALHHCQQALSFTKLLTQHKPGARALWIVTRGAVAVTNEEALAGLTQAPLWGFGRVVALEHKELWGGLVDLAPTPDADDVERLMAVLITRGAEDQVAFRGGQRLVPRLVRHQMDKAQAVRFRADRTYLLTGGLGFLGLAFAERMVANGARHLALLGRHSDAQEAAVDGLRKAGAQVLTLAADVADVTAMERCIETIRSTMPPLAGIVHAAGVTIYQTLQAMQPHELSAMLRPKIVGTLLLHELTKDLPLDFFVCFSSAGSVWGAKGQGHYAAANQFLDRFASYRRSLGMPAVTINWGTVAGERMATNEYFQWLTKIGMSDLGLDRAFAAFLHAIGQSVPQLIVSSMDWRRFREVYEASGPRPLLQELPGEAVSAAAEKPASGLPALPRELAMVPAGERGEAMMTLLQKEVAQVLGETRVPDVRLGFSDLGLDSLMMVELVGRLKAKLGLNLPTTLAFDHANIENLAGHLVQRLFGEAVPRVPPPVPDRTPVASVQNDTPDQIDALIQEELAALQRLLK